MSFYRDHTVKNPKKAKRCYWCGEMCPIGEPRIYNTQIWDGDFQQSHFHTECHSAKEVFMAQTYDPEWPEEGSMKRGKPEYKHP